MKNQFNIIWEFEPFYHFLMFPIQLFISLFESLHNIVHNTKVRWPYDIV